VKCLTAATRKKQGRPNSKANCLLKNKQEQEEFVGVDFDTEPSVTNQ